MSVVRVKLMRDERARWLQPKEILESISVAAMAANLPIRRKRSNPKQLDVCIAPAAQPWCFRCAEYADFPLESAMSSGHFSEEFAKALPPGFTLCWARRFPAHMPGPAGSWVEMGYRFYGRFDEGRVRLFNNAATFPYCRTKKE